ncbi:MAG TPA: hypothetical protein VGJ60_30255 [Chloroflexota bacterium]|jgi:hypothetical protein
MTDPQLREGTHPSQPAAFDVASPEPSHIHIPRPSRLRQATQPRRDDLEQLPLHVALVEDAA